MLGSRTHPLVRAEIDELVKMDERDVRIDLKEGVKRALQGGSRVAFVVKLDAESAFKIDVRRLSLLRLIFDDARKKYSARHGGISAHQYLETCRVENSITKSPDKAAF